MLCGPVGVMRVKYRYFPLRETNGQNSVADVLTSGPRLRGVVHESPRRKLRYRSPLPAPSGRIAENTTYRSSGSTKRLEAPESAFTIAGSARGGPRVPSGLASAR